MSPLWNSGDCFYRRKFSTIRGVLCIGSALTLTQLSQGALLLLGVDDFYFDGVNPIIVLPHPIRRETKNGLIVERESHHAGEAWQGGQVVLSRQDVVSDSRNPADGRNLDKTSLVANSKCTRSCRHELQRDSPHLTLSRLLGCECRGNEGAS